FELEAKANDYGDALTTWKALQPRVPAASRAELQRLADQITAERDSSQPVTTSGAIDRHSWGSRLFRKRFTIAVTGGSVSEIKLRCTKHYLFFKYTPDVQYAIEPNVGECSIEVVGDPGTTFNLTQS